MTASPYAGLPRVDDLFEPGGDEPLWQRLASLPAGLRAARQGDSVLLLRHSDGKAVLASRHFRQGFLAGLENTASIDARFLARRRRSLNQLDGPTHAHLRRLAGPAFRPGFVGHQRPLMRRIMTDLVRSVSADGSCDAVAQLTAPYTVPVICTVLGAPTGDADFLSRAASSWTRGFLDPAAVSEALAAHDAVDGYIAALVEDRRATPGRDLISELLAQETTDDVWEAGVLTELLSALIIAGIDTTRIQLASIVEFLSRHPEYWKLLRDDSSMIPAVAEEITRLTPVASLLRRVATEDVDLGGFTVHKGTLVTLAIASMNRDPDVFPDPDHVDLTRGNPQAHFSFGGGHHFCLGNALGRAEIQEALAVLSEEIAAMHPVSSAVWSTPSSFQGPVSIPLHLTWSRPAWSSTSLSTSWSS